ncbi:hypothetical protein D3C77_282480 [compost metagenome]
MGAETASVFGLSDGNRTFPGEHIGEHQITGFDAEQALASHFAAGQRRLVKSAFSE